MITSKENNTVIEISSAVQVDGFVLLNEALQPLDLIATENKATVSNLSEGIYSVVPYQLRDGVKFSLPGEAFKVSASEVQTTERQPTVEVIQ